MTPEEQNKAIANAIGWKPTADGGITWDADGKEIIIFPDYTRDLNAMHEAEKMLPKDKIPEYEYLLTELANSTGMGLRRYFVGEVFRISRCTAKQRAEAFLKTLNLWQE